MPFTGRGGSSPPPDTHHFTNVGSRFASTRARCVSRVVGRLESQRGAQVVDTRPACGSLLPRGAERPSGTRGRPSPPSSQPVRPSGLVPADRSPDPMSGSCTGRFDHHPLGIVVPVLPRLVTESRHPHRRSGWQRPGSSSASSGPTAPPPSTVSESGGWVAATAARLVRYGTWCSPGSGQLCGRLPVATTNPRRAVMTCPSTSTLHGSVRRVLRGEVIPPTGGLFLSVPTTPPARYLLKCGIVADWLCSGWYGMFSVTMVS